MVNFIFYFLNALRISWDPMEFYERLIDNSPNELNKTLYFKENFCDTYDNDAC